MDREYILNLNDRIQSITGINIIFAICACCIFCILNCVYSSSCVFAFNIFSFITMVIILCTNLLCMTYNCNGYSGNLYRRLFPYMLFTIMHTHYLYNVTSKNYLFLMYACITICIYDELVYILQIVLKKNKIVSHGHLVASGSTVSYVSDNCFFSIDLKDNSSSDTSNSTCKDVCDGVKNNSLCASEDNNVDCEEDKNHADASYDVDECDVECQQQAKRKYIFKKEPHERGKRGRKPSVNIDINSKEDYRSLAREIAYDVLRAHKQEAQFISNDINTNKIDNSVNEEIISE
ncbi:MAG: hypothetical protein ACRCXT_00610 [Paraclostridium sp.]